jgi:hypothetical protein
MKRVIWLVAGSVLLLAGIALSHAAQPDFEVTAPDGRKILLKSDGTWRYVQAKEKEPTKEKEPSKEKEASKEKEPSKDKEASKEKEPSKGKEKGEAILRLEQKVEAEGVCRFTLVILNNLPYEIRSFVPQFSAYRANGVIYNTVGSAFAFVKPGDSQRREIQFRGIECRDISRLQVAGGDKCDMGELDRFSSSSGECLGRVRVLASDVVRFDK